MGGSAVAAAGSGRASNSSGRWIGQAVLLTLPPSAQCVWSPAGSGVGEAASPPGPPARSAASSWSPERHGGALASELTAPPRAAPAAAPSSPSFCSLQAPCAAARRPGARATCSIAQYASHEMQRGTWAEGRAHRPPLPARLASQPLLAHVCRFCSQFIWLMCDEVARRHEGICSQNGTRLAGSGRSPNSAVAAHAPPAVAACCCSRLEIHSHRLSSCTGPSCCLQSPPAQPLNEKRHLAAAAHPAGRQFGACSKRYSVVCLGSPSAA